MDQPQKTKDRALDDAVARTLRDNLAGLQRTAEELQEAFADLVAACASSRPSNALPAMLRARTAAGALAARLDILSNFVTAALQPRERLEQEMLLLRSVEAQQPEAPQMPPPSLPTPMAAADDSAIADVPMESVPPAPVQENPFNDYAVRVPVATPPPVEPAREWVEATAAATEPQEVAGDEPLTPEEHVPPDDQSFDVARLTVEEQELHRRANRVAKVSMQDIQLLKPEDVRLGRENKDICARLRNDIDKARKEYDRRFKAILDHPVDYFHHWMVAILAGGDAEALGEYPYPSPVFRR